jgi:hypothetical protein
MSSRITLLLSLFAVLLVPAAALGHPERPSFFPDYKKGSVPKYRTTGPALVVCKSDSKKRINQIFKGRGPKNVKARKRQLALLKKCKFRHIQDAVEAAKSDYRILILPGEYREEPSLATKYPQAECASDFTTGEGPELATAGYAIAGGKLVPAPNYDYHFKCPKSANLIAITGDDPKDPDRVCDQKCNLQIEGTGKRPRDVQILGDGTKLNLIKADRADGIYLKNFYAERSDFNNLYVLETNGFVFDTIETGPAREYGFLSFASDNGLYTDLDAHHAGDSGIYPGSGPEGKCVRYGIEIRRSRSHHNNMGFSGTAGNGTWYHHNKFDHNGLGGAVDSFAAGHPGQPQDCTKWENNEIFSNNQNIFTEERQDYCRETPPQKRDPYKVCSTFQVPVGTGILIAGGNGNIVRDNYIYDNHRYGVMQLFVPSTFRGEDDPDKQRDTSHGNRYTGNFVGLRPDGTKDPNGMFAWWDEEGGANCWEGNEGPDVTRSDPASLPSCPTGSTDSPGPLYKTAMVASCSAWDPSDDFLDHPPGCDWMTSPPEPKP